MESNDTIAEEFSVPEVRERLRRAYKRIATEVERRTREQPNIHSSIDTAAKQDKRIRTEETAPSEEAELVPRFRSLFLAGAPETHSKMQRPGAKAKYFKRFHRLTDWEIASHIEGRSTFAAPLIGKDGFTREVALDIDQGGEAAITCGLQVAAKLGYSAYGLVSQAVEGGHDGGHIRIPLADIAAPERARLLAEQIKQTMLECCGLPEHTIEVYPTQKGLRLPFGIHTHTGKRGTLLLQDGTRLELDHGEPLTTIGQAITLVEALTPNNPDRLPMLPISVTPVSPPNHLQRTNGASPIQDYNQQTNLLDWLVSVGGRIAASTRGGGYLVHCPCNSHKHHDARPSLEVQPARNPRHGRYVIIGHAPGCLFATERGRIIDAFDAYCRWFGLNTRDALKSLNRL